MPFAGDGAVSGRKRSHPEPSPKPHGSVNDIALNKQRHSIHHLNGPFSNGHRLPQRNIQQTPASGPFLKSVLQAQRRAGTVPNHHDGSLFAADASPVSDVFSLRVCGVSGFPDLVISNTETKAELGREGVSETSGQQKMLFFLARKSNQAKMQERQRVE